MDTPLRALILEDSDPDCALLLGELRRGGFSVTHLQIDSAPALRAGLITENWDIVISDYAMPGFNGTTALKIVKELKPELPFIFVSGTIGEDVAVDAMRNGAHDYVMKGNLRRLVPDIRRELADADVRREHKLAELRMSQLEKFKAIGQLAGGVAHDFNNVIGAILGWAEIGIEESSAQSRQAKLFASIRDQSLRAGDLTKQLLAYARRQILEPKNIDLNRLIEDTTSMLRRLIVERIEIRTVLSPDLLKVRADPSQIEQVFMNLCLNARDAMPDGGQILVETSRVNLEDEYCKRHNLARPGEYVRLSITDTGIGMDSETLGRIFEPFFTTKEVGKGTGLGLATTIGIVRQHEGSIEVYSEPRKGTVFHVFLPESEGSVEARQLIDDIPVRGGTETILVAEDNEGVCEVIQEILASLGYKFIVARDGDKALAKFKENSDSISLLLLDMVMPKASGSEVYARICDLKSDVPVIFTSGYSEEANQMPASIPRTAVILQKPFSPRALGRKIREVLG